MGPCYVQSVHPVQAGSADDPDHGSFSPYGNCASGPQSGKMPETSAEQQVE
jgi:hypothetical protein